MPLADLKRQHADQARLAARTAAAEAALARVTAVLDGYQAWAPSYLLRCAISEPSNCSLCVSPYAECPVH